MSSKDIYIRDVRKDELETVTDMFLRAFLADSVFHYAMGCKLPLENPSQERDRASLQSFFRFLVRMSWLVGGIVTAVVKRDTNNEEHIVASCVWLPPKKRVDLWRVITLLKAGFVDTLRRWGIRGLIRLGFEYVDVAEESLAQGMKAHGVKTSPRKTWYLQLAATNPDHQGKGYMGVLIRDLMEREQNTILSLEATSNKSKAVYTHLGWSVVKEFRIGKGKVAEHGRPPAEGEEALGVPVWTMVKWASS